MIKTRTTLILGAGASLNYGLPLGQQLRDQICALHHNDAVQEVICNTGLDRAELIDFVDTLTRSGYTSVDWFLEERPQFVNAGRIAIAATLIQLEKPERLFPPHATHAHWYELLVNTLLDPKCEFTENQLSIISFNYDRSLECYLFIVLKTRLGSEDEAKAAIDSLNIVHVHGTLGDLLGLSAKGREYSPELDVEAIRTAASKIIVVGEATGETVEFRLARENLEKAKRIVFLGFGFHEASVRRLGVFNDSWDEERRGLVKVGGTCRRIPPHRWLTIKKEVLNNAADPTSHFFGSDVYDYLNSNDPLD